MDELTHLLKISLGVLRKHYNPQGFNIGMNIGKSAGAGVADHYHQHVIPRWAGDSNFMASTGDVRVISFSLDDVYEHLIKHFSKL